MIVWYAATRSPASACRRNDSASAAAPASGPALESLPNLLERQPLRLPRLDLPDALDIRRGIEPVAATGPDRSDQALPFQEAQAGVGHIWIERLHPGDDSSRSGGALPAHQNFLPYPATCKPPVQVLYHIGTASSNPASALAVPLNLTETHQCPLDKYKSIL